MMKSLLMVTLAAATIVGCESGAATAPPVESVPAAPLSADARLDQADDNAEKAIFLLMASVNEGAKKPDKPFGGHRDKAIALLEKARLEIAAAAAYADDPKNTP